MKKHHWIWLALLLAFKLNAEPIGISEAQQQKMGIKLMAVSKSAGSTSQRLPAEVVIPVNQERIVSAPQAGLLTALHAAAGQTVRQGQVLAEISSPELVNLQSEYLQALTRQQLAAELLAKDKALYEEGIIAQRRYLSTRSQHAETSAVLSQHKQALQLAGMPAAEIARLQKSGKLSNQLMLQAPLAGQVIELMVATGQRVEVATPLYRIARLDPLWLDIRAPVDILPALKEGQTVRVVGGNAEGRLIQIMRNVNKRDQTVQLRAEISRNAGTLYPGELVEIEIVGQQVTGADSAHFTIARSAVIRKGDQDYLFVQTAQGFEPVAVEIVSEKSGQVIFKAKLSGQEKIAVSGTAAIKGQWLGVGDE